MKGYIYGLKCPQKKEIRYIGQTLQKPTYRYRNHLSEVKNPRYNTRKVNWINKLLKNNELPELVIIEEIDNISKEQLDGREVYWIQYYKDLGCNLVNLTKGGRDVCKEIKKYHRRTKDRKVYSYNEKTKEIIEYNNVKEASKIVNCNSNNIPKAIHIKGRCSGLYWSYNNFKSYRIKKSRRFIRIAAFNDNFYQEYDSIFDCMDNLNIPRTCKSRVGYRLNDGKSYKGYFFKRLEKKSNAGKKGSALNQ